ncbi:MAG: hypothetical protein ACLUNO_06535 [Oscillospiraceae bacterium]
MPISSEGQDGLYANGYDVQIAQYVANASRHESGDLRHRVGFAASALVNSGAIDAIAAGMSPTAERAAADRLHRYLLRIQPRGHHPQVKTRRRKQALCAKQRLPLVLTGKRVTMSF